MHLKYIIVLGVVPSMVYHLAASKAPDTWYHGVPSGLSEPVGAWSGSAEND